MQQKLIISETESYALLGPEKIGKQETRKQLLTGLSRDYPGLSQHFPEILGMLLCVPFVLVHPKKRNT